MPVRLTIGVSSEGLFDEIRDHFSTHETFSELCKDCFMINSLRFNRLKVKNEWPKSNREVSSWGQEGRRVTAAYLNEEYAGLRECHDAGLRRIWLNRKDQLAPDVVPAHDEDIQSLDDLLKVESLLQKPTLGQCYAWWEEWDVPTNIRDHMQTVAWGAYVLAVKMRNEGIRVDPILTHRGGLLHDIDKIQTLDESGQHGQKGAKFLADQGYPTVAEIIREHIMHRILRPEAEALSWEVKLVYFMDKLVEGDHIVPFNERLTALKQRYPGYRGAMERAESHIWVLSAEIESILSIPGHKKLIEVFHKL